MKCPQGHPNEKNARFCAICGAKLVMSPWVRFIMAVAFVAFAIASSYFFRVWSLILTPVVGIILLNACSSSAPKDGV